MNGSMRRHSKSYSSHVVLEVAHRLHDVVGSAWYCPTIRRVLYSGAFATNSLSPAMSATRMPALSMASTMRSASVPL